MYITMEKHTFWYQKTFFKKPPQIYFHNLAAVLLSGILYLIKYLFRGGEYKNFPGTMFV